ncbi:ComF family protein [Baekduia sp. Peel2402]|uniref:ComF family protein n=1 Tax=Baekduia sp. Peel2402 TaxID=3458296 RepID=UPI00403EDB24
MLLDWLIPALCIACRGDRGDPLCAACRAELPWLGAKLCPRCAQPRPCGRCPARRRAFDGAWAAMAYAGPVPAVVNGLKERGALKLADTMAAQIAVAAPDTLWEPGALLIPVPADPWRRRRRGVDHARELALALGRRTHLDVAPILRRAGSDARQAGRTRGQRLRADAADVQLRTRQENCPVSVLLVDDVHTTGATLHACSLALKGFGASRVVAVTYARAVA